MQAKLLVKCGFPERPWMALGSDVVSVLSVSCTYWNCAVFARRSDSDALQLVVVLQ